MQPREAKSQVEGVVSRMPLASAVLLLLAASEFLPRLSQGDDYVEEPHCTWYNGTTSRENPTPRCARYLQIIMKMVYIKQCCLGTWDLPRMENENCHNKKQNKQDEVGTFEWALPRHANKWTHCAQLSSCERFTEEGSLRVGTWQRQTDRQNREEARGKKQEKQGKQKRKEESREAREEQEAREWTVPSGHF